MLEVQSDDPRLKIENWINFDGCVMIVVFFVVNTIFYSQFT